MALCMNKVIQSKSITPELRTSEPTNVSFRADSRDSSRLCVQPKAVPPSRRKASSVTEKSIHGLRQITEVNHNGKDRQHKPSCGLTLGPSGILK